MSRPPYSLRHRRGSVLLIVLITLVFATSALLLFIEKASTDLLVPIREADVLNDIYAIREQKILAMLETPVPAAPGAMTAAFAATPPVPAPTAVATPTETASKNP